MYHAHRQRPSQSDWPGDNTSATTAAQNADGRLTTCSLLGLYEYGSYPPRHRYELPVVLGRCDPKVEGGREITHCFYGNPSNGGCGPFQASGRLPDSTFHSCLAS